MTVTVRSDNAVTIPAGFRRKHDIKESDKVEILPVERNDHDISGEEIQALKDQVEELF